MLLHQSHVLLLQSLILGNQLLDDCLGTCDDFGSFASLVFVFLPSAVDSRNEKSRGKNQKKKKKINIEHRYFRFSTKKNIFLLVKRNYRDVSQQPQDHLPTELDGLKMIYIPP